MKTRISLNIYRIIPGIMIIYTGFVSSEMQKTGYKPFSHKNAKIGLPQENRTDSLISPSLPHRN
jgi:hypothetical protein